MIDSRDPRIVRLKGCSWIVLRQIVLERIDEHPHLSEQHKEAAKEQVRDHFTAMSRLIGRLELAGYRMTDLEDKR